MTSAKIKEWYQSREKVQTHKRGNRLSQFHTRTTKKVQNSQNSKFIQLLEKYKIEIIYATNDAPFVASFNRTMKRMMDRYMEGNDVSSWAIIFRDLLNAYNNTKHSTTGYAPNDIQRKI